MAHRQVTLSNNFLARTKDQPLDPEIHSHSLLRPSRAQTIEVPLCNGSMGNLAG